MFAAAAFFTMMALIMLSVAFAYFINWNGEGLDLHWAFLIVFGFYLLVAGLMVFVGIRKLKKVKAPQKAIEQGREIPRALKGKSWVARQTRPDVGPPERLRQDQPVRVAPSLDHLSIGDPNDVGCAPDVRCVNER